jgi:hypothetical protein
MRILWGCPGTRTGPSYSLQTFAEAAADPWAGLPLAVPSSTDTIRPDFPSRMGFVSVPPDPVQRLADVLHQLSAVTEAITWRLLELEERLQAQEECLQGLKVNRPPPTMCGWQGSWTGRWVAPRSDWLAFEGMLRGLEPTSSPQTICARSNPIRHPIQQEPIGSRTPGNPSLPLLGPQRADTSPHG